MTTAQLSGYPLALHDVFSTFRPLFPVMLLVHWSSGFNKYWRKTMFLFKFGCGALKYTLTFLYLLFNPQVMQHRSSSLRRRFWLHLQTYNSISLKTTLSLLPSTVIFFNGDGFWSKLIMDSYGTVQMVSRWNSIHGIDISDLMGLIYYCKHNLCERWLPFLRLTCYCFCFPLSCLSLYC